MMKLVLFGTLLIISCCHIVEAGVVLEEGSPCRAQSGDGICRRDSDCPQILEDFKIAVEVPMCGFVGMDAIVCCPKSPTHIDVDLRNDNGTDL